MKKLLTSMLVLAMSLSLLTPLWLSKRRRSPLFRMCFRTSLWP